MRDENAVNSHTVTLTDRRRAELSGIDDVLSFDDGGLSAHSALGDIYIEGEELKVEGFSAERGLLTVSGLIFGIYYTGDGERVGTVSAVAEDGEPLFYSLSEQLYVTLYSLFMGAFLGVIYDFYRLIRITLGVGVTSGAAGVLYRKRLPLLRGDRGMIALRRGDGALSAAAHFAGDITVSLICAAAYALFLFHACRGVIRWTYLISSALGFALYRRSLSRFIIAVLEVAVFFLRVILRYLTEIVLLPLRPVSRLVLRGWRRIYGWITSGIGSFFSRMKEKGRRKDDGVSREDFPVIGKSGRGSRG